jgi:hypothetical protein
MRSPHKTLIGFLFLAALGCDGGADDAQMIVGSWWAGAAPNWATDVGSTGSTTAIAIMFTSDGQYSAIKEQITSDGPPGATTTDMATANAEVEDGTYTVSGSTLTCVPTESTCPEPDPFSNVFISFTGSELDLDTSSGIVSLQKNTANNVWGIIKTYGCFDSSGHFTEEPPVPVSNY